MRLTNAMETAVKTHLQRLQGVLAGRQTVCWCPRCRADIMALALTSLTPRYFTRRNLTDEIEHAQAAAVREELALAARHVERHPRHPRDEPVPAEEPIWIVNYPLEEGFRAIDALLGDKEESCFCWRCRCDMVAFALNRYPARYGVEHRGKTRLSEGAREQIRQEISPSLLLGLQVVRAVPKHDLPASHQGTGA